MALTGWGFYKTHTIAGTTAGAQTDYVLHGQLSIVVHYGVGSDSGRDVYLNSKCEADFSDLRFTESTGTTELQYSILNIVKSDYCVVAVEVPSIPVSPGTIDIRIYYEKSTSVYNGDIANLGAFGDQFQFSGTLASIQGDAADEIFTSVFTRSQRYGDYTFFPGQQDPSGSPSDYKNVVYRYNHIDRKIDAVKTIQDDRGRDTHNHTFITVLSDGRLVGVGTAHHTQLYGIRTTNVGGDISAFDAEYAVTGATYGTYPNLQVMSDDSIYLTYRSGSGSGNQSYLNMSISTNDGVSFGSPTTVINWSDGTDPRIYHGACKGTGDKLYLMWGVRHTFSGNDPANWKGIYLIYYNKADSTWYDMAGNSYTTPIDLADLNAAAKIETANNFIYSTCGVFVDSSDAPHVVYHYKTADDAQSFNINTDIRIAKWNGSSWDKHTVKSAEEYYSSDKLWIRHSDDQITILSKHFSINQKVLELTASTYNGTYTERFIGDSGGWNGLLPNTFDATGKENRLTVWNNGLYGYLEDINADETANTWVTSGALDAECWYRSDGIYLNSTREVDDQRIYTNPTIPANWKLSLSLQHVNGAISGANYLNISSTSDNIRTDVTGGVADNIGLRTFGGSGTYAPTLQLQTRDGGTTVTSTAHSISDGSFNYIEMKRTSDTNAEIEVFSDDKFSTSTYTASNTISSGLTGLNYLKATNDNDGTGAGATLYDRYDQMILSEVAEPEPTHSTWGAETVAGAITVSVGLASESDSSFATSLSKNFNIGLSEESSSSFTITPVKTLSAGLSVETDTAFDVSIGQIIGAGLASELSASFDVSINKILNADLSTEASTASAVSRLRVISIGLSSEVDSSFSSLYKFGSKRRTAEGNIVFMTGRTKNQIEIYNG